MRKYGKFTRISYIFSNFKSLLLRHFSTDCLEIENVASGKAAGKSYDPILLISLTVLEIFRLTFQKTHFFTLKIQDGRRNYGEIVYPFFLLPLSIFEPNI